MSEQDGKKGFNRPWEEGEEDASEVVSLFDDGEETTPEAVDASEAETPTDPAEDDDDALVDWEAMAGSRSRVEDYTAAEYLAATTQEYQGLAEEVNRRSGEEWEKHAAAAEVAGVGSGLVGFGDVSGTAVHTEEDFEAHEQAVSSDVALRIFTGLVIFGLFLGSLVLGGWWFTGFVTMVMLIAVGELYGTMRTKGFKPLALFGLLGILLVGIGTHTRGVFAIGGWVAIATLATLLFVSLTPRRKPLEDSTITIMGLCWVGMLAFAIPFGFAATPVAWVFFVVFLVALCDIGGFFVGRSFGKRPLAPRLSPNKTIEGVIGGLVLAAMGASVLVAFPQWEPIGLGRGLVMAAIVGVVSPIGDLVESMVKRSIDVKDMGSILPGHGGMLDRIDSFLFAVPALYFAFMSYGLL